MSVASIDPATSLGAVQLTVGDLARAREFYETVVGLRTLDASDSSDGSARLGAAAGAPLVEFVRRPDAPPRPRRSTGLFHLALLVPGRADLAAAVRRVADAGWALSGASDHLVSEALYLDDPEGNGLEIYRDRPREEWRYRDGALQMATEPLDLQGVMAELRPEPDDGMPGATRLGHVHLQVSDLAAAEAFYHGVLGFDVTVRTYPGALFVSAGGYHHHIALNTWAGTGAPAPPPGARGLRRFEIVLAGAQELGGVEQRLRAGGVDVRRDAAGRLVADPAGNRILLRAPTMG